MHSGGKCIVQSKNVQIYYPFFPNCFIMFNQDLNVEVPASYKSLHKLCKYYHRIAGYNVFNLFIDDCNSIFQGIFLFVKYFNFHQKLTRDFYKTKFLVLKYSLSFFKVIFSVITTAKQY